MDEYENGLRILARVVARSYLEELAQKRTRENSLKKEPVMPIKGVSEVIRLPRLGKIRLGVRKDGADGAPYPSPTDYFVCPDEVKKVFGERPKELRIMFPTDDPTQLASQYLRYYSESRRLICRGDGVTAVARMDAIIGGIADGEEGVTELREITCNPDKCIYHQREQCRRMMNLQFLLPDCPGFGVYQLDTSSFHSIVNINSSLELIRGICGRLAMIPLSLRLIEREVLPEGRKKTVQVLSLTAAYSLAIAQKYAQIPPGQTLLLPAPDSEAPDDLFSHESYKPGKSVKPFSDPDRKLMDLWARVKRKICQLDVQDAQVAGWFRRYYHLDVGLGDFDLVEPPPRLTAERLSRFLKTLERHADHIYP